MIIKTILSILNVFSDELYIYVHSRHSYKSHHQSSDTRQAPAPAPAPLKSIAATAAATPALSTLLAAVKAAGLAETLSGEGDFTVFAPTNDGFTDVPTLPLFSPWFLRLLMLQPMNKELLSNVLLRHVLPTRIMADEIPQGTTKLKTVGGEDIEITKQNSKITIKSPEGTATVTATDILTSNGVVHLVDAVF